MELFSTLVVVVVVVVVAVVVVVVVVLIMTFFVGRSGGACSCRQDRMIELSKGNVRRIVF